MNPASWNWTTLILITLVYWMLTIVWWIMRQRRRSRKEPPTSVTPVSETVTMVAFDDSIDLLVAGVVLVGPPLLLIILKLVSGS